MLKKLALVAAPTLGIVLAIVLWRFPWATDDPLRREDALKSYYEFRYASRPTLAPTVDEANRHQPILRWVETFVRDYGLQEARVLDVGSGTGYLQDVVDDYTGLDIADDVAPLYHKPFIPGTATALPFDDDAFDVVWSVWVLEHIPNAEAALTEMRRVVRPGGLIYLAPAWFVPYWAPQGYMVRPYEDLGLWGKLAKASLRWQRSVPYRLAATVPARLVRSVAVFGGPTRLHYYRLTPNYEHYWQPDSNAVNRLDPVEVAMWFETRGDTCLNCLDGFARYWQGDVENAPLIIRRASRDQGDAISAVVQP